MENRQLKRKAFYKTLLVSLTMVACTCYFLFSLPKSMVLVLILIDVFFDTFSDYYTFYISKAKMQSYIRKFQLSPEILAEIAGRSKYDFPVNSRGKIYMVSSTFKDYQELVQRLSAEYGEL